MAWNEPYLETCCRSALRRLALAGPAGRPADGMDRACLARLIELGRATRREDGRVVGIADEGTRTHGGGAGSP
ncbi:MAG: hypothetical protein KGI51_03040 [Rhodospirillales bacterium]|nr:hypothetical protein [Rhodospirillales bacterium]